MPEPSPQHHPSNLLPSNELNMMPSPIQTAPPPPVAPLPATRTRSAVPTTTAPLPLSGKARTMTTVLAIFAAHLLLLSLVIGLRHPTFFLTASSSATIIWGGLFFWRGPHCRYSMFIGAVLALGFEQAACHWWFPDLPSLWWPLAQYACVQYLTAFTLHRIAA